MKQLVTGWGGCFTWNIRESNGGGRAVAFMIGDLFRGIFSEETEGFADEREAGVRLALEAENPAERVEDVLVLGLGGVGSAGELLGPVEFEVLERKFVGDVVEHHRVVGVSLFGGAEVAKCSGEISVLERAKAAEDVIVREPDWCAAERNEGGQSSYTEERGCEGLPQPARA